MSSREDRLLKWAPWTPPKEKVTAPRAEGPGEHAWELAGTKADPETPVTYFLWSCPKCGRRAVTETASKDGEHFADQNTPGEKDLRRASVDEDCRQALVDGVSRR